MFYTPMKEMFIEVILRKYVINQRHVTNVQITTSMNLFVPKAQNGKSRIARRKPIHTLQERHTFLV